MGLEPETAVFRFTLLFFSCMLTFGTYFCFDMPSVLQKRFTCSIMCDTNTTANSSNITSTTTVSTTTDSGNTTMCGEECLDLSDDNYNLLYAIYAWTNAVVVIGAGVLIDKLGVRLGVTLFSMLCLIGSVLFALGTVFQGQPAMFPIMLIGRLLFGSGNGSLTVVQNKIVAFWFKDKELALAFGISLAFSRLGSVLNFLLTETITEKVGLKWILWGGAMLVAVGFICALILCLLDKYGTKKLGVADEIVVASKRVRLRDIKDFTLSYFLLSLTIVFFYNGVFPFVADASKFITTKYKNIGDREADYVAGAVYDCSMVLSPFLGGLIDRFGKRGYLAVLCAIGTIPVFGILAFTEVYPLVATLWLGITYSFAASSTWPSIPLVVKDSVVGTAMGITTSMQMIGIGVCNTVVGAILGDEKKIKVPERLERWKSVMIFLLANVLACVVTAVLLNINDKRKKGILNISKKEKLNREMQEKRANIQNADGERDALLPPSDDADNYGAVES